MKIARKLLLILSVIIGVLLLLNVVTYFNYHNEAYLFNMFNFDKEKNIPSIFSALILLLASTTLLYVSFQALSFQVSNVFWRSLSIIFLFLSFDELLRIHEKVGAFTASHIKGDGAFHYEWLIPYSVILLFLIFTYAKSIFALPTQVRNNMIISGILFVGGAVGFEMIGGMYIEEKGLLTVEAVENSTSIFVLYTVEETLEMLGVVYFIYTIFLCIETSKIRGTVS